MAKPSCCHKKKLRRGLWSPEEDEKLMNHIATYGHGCWSSVPKQAGLERCGKSCRLRWINYLRPDLKRGTFSQEEEDLIIQLHSMLGNKWSQIAAQLPGRTDNEVKNFWNSYIKKKLRERGIDPVTHRPLSEPAAAAAAATTPAPYASCAALFIDADLAPTRAAPMPLAHLDASHDMPLPGYRAPNYAAYFDMEHALNHGAAPGAMPSASSSNASSDVPWLELGQGAEGHVEQYGALDELKWSDYFEGCFHSAASHGLQEQCIYEDSKDEVVQFDVHGLSNWC